MEKNEKILFFNTQEFNMIFSQHGLNRHQRFIHSVDGFKKPIYRYEGHSKSSKTNSKKKPLNMVTK